MKHTMSSVDDQIELAAHKLAVHFSDDADRQARYRRLTDSSRKSRKLNEDSEIERRFKAHVTLWVNLIETMLAKIENAQAWRFINLSPHFDDIPIDGVTGNKDFRDFVDYVVLRKEAEKCDHDEIGSLSLLLGAFQRVIERRIQA